MPRYILLLPASLTMTLLAYVLAPVLPVFADRAGWLPKWLSYFQTPDNTIYGDQGHLERWDYCMSYAQQVAWLIRNPAYGFEWTCPLSAEITPAMRVELEGNPWIKNRTSAIEGSYFCRVGDFWNYKLIKHLFGDLCFMAEFGWKLQGFAKGRETEGNAMYVCSIRLTAFNP